MGTRIKGILTYHTIRMKSFIIAAGMVLLCQQACRSTRFSNREQHLLTTLEQSHVQGLSQRIRQLSRAQSVTDSGAQEYRITIFPTDSFQFSPERGFIGKASKIELSGSIHRLQRIQDSTDFKLSEIRESKTTRISKQNSKQVNNSKSIEKTKLTWWALGLAVIVLFLWVKIRMR